MKNIFLRKGVEIILLINGNNNMCDISYHTKSPYSYVHDIIRKFHYEGIVSIEKRGRISEIILTKKGSYGSYLRI